MFKTFDREKAKNATIDELRELILLALNIEISEKNLTELIKIEKLVDLKSCVDMGNYLLFMLKKQPIEKYQIKFISVQKMFPSCKYVKINF